MPSAMLTSKGQITIPASVRRAMQVENGDRIDFVEVSDGRFEIVAASRSIKEFAGMFAGTVTKDSRTISIEKMNEVIASEGSKTG